MAEIRGASLNLSINTAGGVEQLRAMYEGILNDHEFNRALALGINDTMKQVRTMIGREIRQTYNIRAGYLTGKFIRINPAFVSRGGQKTKLSSTMSFSSMPIPIGEFVRRTVAGQKHRSALLNAKGKNKRIGNQKSQIGVVIDRSMRGGVVIEVLKGHQEFVASAFVASRTHMVVSRSNSFDGKSYNLGPNKAFNFRHSRVNKGSDTPVGSLFTASPFSTATNKIVQRGVYTFAMDRMDRIILSKLEAMANGLIRNASNGRSYRRP
jgi:hypothetical protein